MAEPVTPLPGQRWRERAGGPSWVITSLGIRSGVEAVEMSGPGPCRGMQTVPLVAFLEKWENVPGVEGQPGPFPIVCSSTDLVDGHHVERVAWEVHTSTTAAGLERLARAILTTGALVTSSYLHGLGAYKMGRGVSASWLLWIAAGQEVVFDAIAKPEERRHPSRLSVPSMHRACKVGEVATTETLSCEGCQARIVRADYVSGEWVYPTVDGHGHWQDDGKAWAGAATSFRARHTVEAHRTEFAARRLAMSKGHIPDEDAWLVYTTAEEGHGGVLLFWKRGENGGGAGYTSHIEEAGRWTHTDAVRLGAGARDKSADPRYTTGDHPIRYMHAVAVARRVVPIGAHPKPDGARW